MKTFALGTFSTAQDPSRKFAGVVVDHKVANLGDLAKEYGFAGLIDKTVLSLLDDWQRSLEDLQQLVHQASAHDWTDERELRFHSPVDLPRQVFCTGANYRKHVVDLTVDSKVGPEGLNDDELRAWAEDMMDKRVAHGEPYVFTKPVSAISGAYDDLVLPPTTRKPDWELELAVVIGQEAYNVSEADAMNYVAGYTIVNDISARDLIPRTDYKMLGTDWLRSKGQPGFLPIGPYLVPRCFIENPYELSMKLTVSGAVMQDETTADMLFTIEKQIAYITRYARLLPGDIICTGSPAGNGTHYNRFLEAGDVMEGAITGLGHQRQKCVV
ncbi:fumarylacetoacetate hydrolase family protein [Pseudomonas syringae]|nr:fumarylacetoacetate hydrolase family protein [Pseudomonas syringae]MBD8577152.1 fumarylacetoacetate hydrolase family protein [Pseudomonas syringae]MBD8792774.1 fumarylacetoacetate hydrolase family protein [Pseudomonas syringae]MBD8803277.1 fumarylacetoacetate hydrolase family protein [Pseudomonas syringae]MBD8811874.1 fumarylacetoacetate hydrolase family protein [Pseudomonas syringae]